jgi:hypothetical protein
MKLLLLCFAGNKSILSIICVFYFVLNPVKLGSNFFDSSFALSALFLGPFVLARYEPYRHADTEMTTREKKEAKANVLKMFYHAFNG